MYLKKMQVKEFISQADKLWKEMKDEAKFLLERKVTDSEIKSWQKSLPELADTLKQSSDLIQDCLIYLEYIIPGCNDRLDVLIVGLDCNGYRSGIIIELKQWSNSSINVDSVDGLNVIVSGKLHLHPSQQALAYRDYLLDSSSAFADKSCSLRSCSYLHNAHSNSDKIKVLKSELYKNLVDISPLFCKDEEKQLLEFISDSIYEKPDSHYIWDLDHNKVEFSKRLHNTVSTAVKEKEEWNLIGKQLLV